MLQIVPYGWSLTHKSIQDLILILILVLILLLL